MTPVSKPSWRRQSSAEWPFLLTHYLPLGSGRGEPLRPTHLQSLSLVALSLLCPLFLLLLVIGKECCLQANWSSKAGRGRESFHCSAASRNVDTPSFFTQLRL